MLIKNGKILDFTKEFYGDIKIENGKITQIGTDLNSDGEEIIDAKGLTVMPAFVDTHVHFRTPGFEAKETIETGSTAAAKGGYTFVNLMPNTNPVCSNSKIALDNMKKAEDFGKCSVNQCVSITENFDGKTISHLENLDSKIKFISEDGKGVMSNDIMAKVMDICAKKDLTICSHAEDMVISKYDYRLAENIETARNLLLSNHYGTKLHMCHVSTKESAQYIIFAKNKGTNVTLEVCPHHIWFDDEVFNGRVNPPIRKRYDVDFLIHAMLKGDIDCIATDHAPHTKEDKEAGAPGFVGLETAFAVCYTKLCVENDLPLGKLSKMMSYGGAKILGLNKGKIEIGFDGDVVLVDTEKTFTLDKNTLVGKSNNTCFDGEKLQGEIVLTIKNGEITYEKQGELK